LFVFCFERTLIIIMADAALEDAMKATISSMGKAITKPPMTKKLLKKPPFRFLYDVVMEVMKTSGFLQGLYTPEEIDPEAVKDKAAKIVFLQKAIDATALATGKKLTAKPSKIASGADPEATNAWLQAMGKGVLKKIDSSDAVKRVLAGESPSKPSKPASGKTLEVPEAKEKKEKSGSAKTEKEGAKKSGSAKKPAEKKPSEKKPSDSSASKRDSSATKRDGSAKREGSAVKRDSSATKRDSSATKRDGSASKSGSAKRDGSAKREGSAVKKSGSATKRDGSATKRDGSAKREGSEKKGKPVDEDMAAPKPKDDGGKRREPSARPRTKTDKGGKAMRPGKATGERRRPDQDQDPDQDHDQDQDQDQDDEAAHHNHNEEKEVVADDGGDDNTTAPPVSGQPSEEHNQDADVEVKQNNRGSVPSPDREKDKQRIERPSSARRTRPEPIDNTASHSQGDDAEDVEPEPTPAPERPKTSRRVKKVANDAPLESSKIKKEVEIMVDGDDDEEDDDPYVVVETKAAPTPTIDPNADKDDDDDEEKGFLMRKIQDKKNIDAEALKENPENAAIVKSLAAREEKRKKEREAVTSEVAVLREGIQTLCRTANPLGKIVDYVQEDVDAMQAEMGMWQEELAANKNKIADDAAETDKYLQPLKVKLYELDQQILDQQAMIRAVKATIFQNDEKIQNPLRGIALAN